jgi:hypothetical protein
MIYPRLDHLPDPDNNHLPVETSWHDALETYLKRLWFFLAVVLMNILIFAAYLVAAGIKIVPK